MSSSSDVTASHVVGAILLIAGSCIGAGMLALPVVTGLAGFFPSLIAFILAWLFMMATAFLLLEVNIWIGAQASFITMAQKTLGKWGRITSWLAFVFLFYALLVAYIAGSGSLISDITQDYIGYRPSDWIGSFACTLLFGWFVYYGTKAVDLFNRILMAGLIVTYVALVALGFPHVQSKLLLHRDWAYSLSAVPVLIISFGFHNMIPTLTTYLKKRIRYLRITVLIGSLIPLVVYLIWQLIILGIVPARGEHSFETSLGAGDFATQSLRDVVGQSWVVWVAEYFAFFALVTSFIAQGLSLTHFLADGLKVPENRKNTLYLTFLTFLPPFVFALAYPNIFITALEVAGGFFAVILFGILPALMAWKGRYGKREIIHRCLPGGRVILILIVLFSLVIMAIMATNLTQTIA